MGKTRGLLPKSGEQNAKSRVLFAVGMERRENGGGVGARGGAFVPARERGGRTATERRGRGAKVWRKRRIFVAD